ncbi:MAG: redox-sensing transcriptional repressor Rex [Chloroflexi bacterium]|nr:redox-sensing transcriptional repressor Rex [Chloroflexota bacterium]
MNKARKRLRRDLALPRPTLARLPLYYRRLMRALDEGTAVVSSQELGEAAGVPAAQARKDLCCVGDFGRPGVGYVADTLAEQLAEFLGLAADKQAIVVGAGRLGQALAAYTGFTRYGLQVMALFDISPSLFVQQPGQKPVLPMARLEEWFATHRVDVALITVPAFAAQAVADRLVTVGARALWNFTPRELVVPPYVYVQSEDLGTRSALISYHLRKQREEPEL